MRKLFTLLLAFAASVGTLLAWDYEHIQIGDLYYNLDASNQTAEVTSQNSEDPYWSTSITTATIPSSVEYNSVTYSVTSIGNSAFYGCSGLSFIEIPNSVTSISSWAFYCCTGLTAIEIPSSVTSIGEVAFWGCSNLMEITNHATLPQTIDNYVFEGNEWFHSVDKTTCKLFVPEKSIDLYRAANGWMAFENILPFGEAPTAIDKANANAKAVKILRNGNVYILTGDKTYTITGQQVK